MTTELEKQFFDTFGIEPKYTYLVTDTFYTNNSHTYTATKDDLIDYFEGKNCGRYKVIKVYKNYPQITDHILLELIRIIGLITIKYTNEQCEICYSDGAISYLGKDLKEAILNLLISKVSIFKHQVQAIFEGKRWK